MTRRRGLLLAGSAILAAGAAAHLAIIAIGPTAYATLGAPAKLVALAGTAPSRAAVSCVAIACLLLLAALYGISAADIGPRLPGRRPVVALLGAGLVARAVLMPLAIAWRPDTVAGICGKCESVNGFVIATSALCLFVGIAYASGALLAVPRRSPN